MPLPTPNTGEEQNKFVSRCMSVLKGEFPDQKQRTAVCFSQWRKKSGGKKPGDKMKKENVKLRFSSPITESLTVITEGKEDKDKIKIKGTMIKAATSRNNRTYTVEELQKASFTGNTISIDHTDSVKDNVGFYEHEFTSDGYDFDGVVYNTPYHPGIVEMLKKGLVKFVSIEAIAKEVVKEGDSYIARGLDFTGLGLVKTPGFPEATVAIAEAFKDIPKPVPPEPQPEANEEEEVTEIGDKIGEKMEKKLKEQEEQPEAPKEEEKEEPKEEEKTEEPKAEEKKDTLNEELTKKLDALMEKVKKLEEKPSKGIITETPKEEGIKLVTKKKEGLMEFYPANPEEAY